MVARNVDVLENLHESIGMIFDQAQLSLANHRKNCVALYKLHQQAATLVGPTRIKADPKLIGERKFREIFIGMVNCVLVVKKGPATADRVVRFVGAYVKFINDRASIERENALKDPSSSISARLDDDPEDTTASRFIVREDTYNFLKDGLIDRICDKEAVIRAHAAMALSRLAGTEDPDEVAPGEKTILEILTDVLTFDPAPEVRRAALISLPLLPLTTEAILSRTRDTDSLTRKLVYSNVLSTKLEHPRLLTIAQRELVFKDGLGDREPTVRVAAGKLASSWFDIVLDEPNKAEEYTWDGDDGGVMKGLIRFLSLFDVVGPSEAVAVDAVLSIFVTRPSIAESLVFPEQYWKELTPESAVLARLFLQHCLSTKNETRIEAASLPVVTAFAFLLQDAYNALLDILQDEENVAFLNEREPQDEEDVAKRQEELSKKEVILGELLRMSLKLDFMDEIGRRKVFTVVKDMVAHSDLPPGLINPCLDVLKEILPTERELIRVVVEIIVDLREDNQDANDVQSLLQGDPDMTQTSTGKDRSLQRNRSRADMSPEEQMEADIIDVRCLLLCIGMLERVDGSFEDNSTLEGILADLIIPSVKRKEPIMREKGLISLGLCCLIAKNMALNSFQLFLTQVQTAPEELKLHVLQVIFDILITYAQDFFLRSDEIAQKIIGFLLQTLESEDSPSIQALLCVGLSKLLLFGIIKDSKVLTSLVLIYVSPNTSTNQELRQCLSYFFPVYCYSSPDNQARMQSIFIPAFDSFMQARENLDEDQDMIEPLQFGLLLVDWTNPQKRAEMMKTELQSQAAHVDVAVNILSALYDSDRSGAFSLYGLYENFLILTSFIDEGLKVLSQLLSHLHLISGLDDRSIHKLNLLLSHHKRQAPFEDDSVEKIFNKFLNKFASTFEEEIERIDPRHYLDDEFVELYTFIGVDPPDESSEVPAPFSKSQDPRIDMDPLSDVPSENDIPSSTDEEGASSPTPSPQKRPTSKPKKVTKTRKATTASPIPPEDSEVEQPLELGTPVANIVTPKKKKGVKRILTPGSAVPNSPLNRKKSRVNGSRKARSKTRITDASDTENEVVRTKKGQPRTLDDSEDDATSVLESLADSDED
ncbi:hypothetical protein H0H93_007772 [Arthromyces matolae]|nr:hypothetical protein H0H93_007772 [Arthromyces matolae]